MSIIDIEDLKPGMTVYETGDGYSGTRTIIITKDNLPMIQAFWNRLFFASKEYADIITDVCYRAMSDQERD